MKLNLRYMKLLGSGCECRCYELSRRLVLKIYGTKKERNNAWKRQRQAYRAGVAPRTFGVLDSKTKYGYISARAVGVTEKVSFRPLHHAAELLGFASTDIYGDNVGLWQGRIVIVDFGDCSMDTA